MESFFYLASFFLFMVLQSFFVVGVFICFRGSEIKDGISGKVEYQGMVFYMLAPKFFERNKNKSWSKPTYSCYKCMASLYSLITYWPVVIYLFGFNAVQVPIWAFNSLILVTMNSYIYKNI